MIKKSILLELDRRYGSAEGKEEYYIFNDFTKEEEEKLWYGSAGINELTKTKEYVWEDEELEEYKQRADEAKSKRFSIIGTIIYSESDNRFVEYTE